MFIAQKIIKALIFSVAFVSISFGASRLYLSNNHSIISLEEAYERLISTPELDLEQNMIPILQKYHVEQGQFQEALGVYFMVSSQKNTADNTVVFDFSPLQPMKKSQLSSIAKELAENFDQESVAITSLDQNSQEIIDRVVSFQDDKPLLSEVTLKIKEQLPAKYQTAYTLYIDAFPKDLGYKQAKISKIEWIGNNLSTKELQVVFNQASIQESRGRAWLVYKNGRVQDL